MTQKQYQELHNKVADLLAENGFDQFVVMAHNCEKSRVWVGRSKKSCSLTRTVNQVVHSIAGANNSTELMNSHTSDN